MITDIFSSFDPATNSLFQSSSTFFWFFNIIIIIVINASYWILPNQVFWICSIPLNLISTQIKTTFGFHLKGINSIITPLFIFLISVNLLGLIPYIFRFSSHLIFTFSLGIPLWLSLILSGIITSPSSVAAHLLPGGAPDWLNPALILIETTRILIRPLTLCVRLAANITAGHIIIDLLRTYLTYSIFIAPITGGIFLFLIQIGYSIFEMGICLIQAYVFCLLLTLYSDDHPANWHFSLIRTYDLHS